jgi:hypothetical protein
LVPGGDRLNGCALHVFLQLLHLEAAAVAFVDIFEASHPSLHVLNHGKRTSFRGRLYTLSLMRVMSYCRSTSLLVSLITLIACSYRGSSYW